MTVPKTVPILDSKKFMGETPIEDPGGWIKEKWKDVLIFAEPEEEIPLLRINHIPIASAGNHTLIIGAKKCRKTLFAVWLLSQYEGDLATEALIFDTEQGKRHVWRVQDKIKQITGKEVPVFFLRGQSAEDRMKIIEDTIKYWEDRPRLILIDGIRDLMANINDPVESTKIVEWLGRLTTEYNIHIINVLHTNKNDGKVIGQVGNGRGHVGTELANKAQTTIGLVKDPKTGVTMVSCEDSRDEQFDGFAFTHGATGLPEIVNAPISGHVLSDDEMKERLKLVFQDGPCNRTTLEAGIKMYFDVKQNKVVGLIGLFERMKWMARFGKAHTKDVTYKIMIS